MRLLFVIVTLASALSAQTFVLSNLSNQDLDELELFEQRNNINKQVRDLYIAGASGPYTFDVAAEVCLQLQAQLEGTENRISVARRDFIQSVQMYNTEIRTFPGRLWHSMMYSDLPIRETFEARAGADEAPVVEF